MYEVGSRRVLRWMLLCLLPLPGCDAGAGVAPPERPVFEVEVTGERFRVLLPRERLAEAEALLSAGGTVVVHGELARGDGGFNAPYRWHLRPETVSFPDVAMEVCSGRPRSDVEADPDYWIETVGVYCPWGARLVRRVDG